MSGSVSLTTLATVASIASAASGVASTISGLVSGGGVGGSTSGDAAASTTTESKKAKLARSALLSTEGGINGSELNPNQVSSNRQTLLGN